MSFLLSDPSKAKNVKTSVDYLLGYARTEVLCAVCDGHLGHVFKGEGFDTPTDKRYCINGTVLKFILILLQLEKSQEIKKVEGSNHWLIFLHSFYLPFNRLAKVSLKNISCILFFQFSFCLSS